MQKFDAIVLDKKLNRLLKIGINAGVTSFEEKPSDEFVANNDATNFQNGGGNIDAYKLFSIFTADIIMRKVVFVR